MRLMLQLNWLGIPGRSKIEQTSAWLCREGVCPSVCLSLPSTGGATRLRDRVGHGWVLSVERRGCKPGPDAREAPVLAPHKDEMQSGAASNTAVHRACIANADTCELYTLKKSLLTCFEPNKIVDLFHTQVFVTPMACSDGIRHVYVSAAVSKGAGWGGGGALRRHPGNKRCRREDKISTKWLQKGRASPQNVRQMAGKTKKTRYAVSGAEETAH